VQWIVSIYHSTRAFPMADMGLSAIPETYIVYRSMAIQFIIYKKIIRKQYDKVL